MATWPLNETPKERQDRVARIAALVKAGQYTTSCESLASAILAGRSNRGRRVADTEAIVRRRAYMREYMRARRKRGDVSAATTRKGE